MTAYEKQKLFFRVLESQIDEPDSSAWEIFLMGAGFGHSYGKSGVSSVDTYKKIESIEGRRHIVERALAMMDSFDCDDEKEYAKKILRLVGSRRLVNIAED